MVQIGEVVLAALVVRNKLLLALEEFLALLLEGLALRPLVVDTRRHELVLIIVGMLRMLGEELFHGDERQLLVLVAVREG